MAPPHSALLLAAFLAVPPAAHARAPLPADGSARAAPAEDVRVVDLIDNGGFAGAGEVAGLPAGAWSLPWWRVRAGAPRPEDGACDTGPGDVLEQPVAAHAPLARRLVLRGLVEGRGRLELVEEDGTVRLREAVSGAFEVALADADGGAATPRFLLRLSGEEGVARWRRVEALVPLPDPSPEALRAEVLRHLDEIHSFWLERALDDVGPRATAFVAFGLDAETGERTAPLARVGPHPLWSQVLAVAGLEEDGDPASERPAARLRRDALARYLDDLLELGLDGTTGLPRTWDPARDEPDSEGAMEIAIVLDLLIDVAEEGPADFRERARAAALRIGETVLARGLRPDGTVAAAYRPRDGEPTPIDVPLRQLDVPAQLGRMEAWRGDGAFARAAREALWTLEYKHTWPAAWGKIDPGFDDIFGHLGARALVLWRALPDEPAFRRLVVSGVETYEPALRDLVRFGGYVAADQVRGWRIFVDVAAREPARAERIGDTLWAAARQHFKGMQGDEGFWLDVTMDGWDPVSNLPVGDLGGLPQNLLEGLAVLAREESGLSSERRADVRAMFTAVMRSSDEAYRAGLAHVMTPRRGAGFRSAEGSLRFAAGLVAMLESLSPPLTGRAGG